jgi:hypothetical protein
MLASIQPASVNQSKADLGIPTDSDKCRNALDVMNRVPIRRFFFGMMKTLRKPKETEVANSSAQLVD